MSERRDLDVIAALVPPGSRVLDLGCGSGELLARLVQAKGCSGYGVEIADDNVLACARRGRVSATRAPAQSPYTPEVDM